MDAPDHGNRVWKVALVDGNPASWEIGSIERIQLILIAAQEFGQLFAGEALGELIVIRGLAIPRIQDSYLIAVRVGDVGVKHDLELFCARGARQNDREAVREGSRRFSTGGLCAPHGMRPKRDEARPGFPRGLSTLRRRSSVCSVGSASPLQRHRLTQASLHLVPPGRAGSGWNEPPVENRRLPCIAASRRTCGREWPGGNREQGQDEDEKPDESPDDPGLNLCRLLFLVHVRMGLRHSVHRNGCNSSWWPSAHERRSGMERRD